MSNASRHAEDAMADYGHDDAESEAEPYRKAAMLVTQIMAGDPAIIAKAQQEIEDALTALTHERQRAEKAEEIAAQWCWNPDEVGRSCGECENCQRHEKLLARAETAERQLHEARTQLRKLVEAVTANEAASRDAQVDPERWSDSHGAMWIAADEARSALSHPTSPNTGETA